jgi:hypothetical protein
MPKTKNPSSDPEAKVAEPQAPVVEAEVPSPEAEAGELPDETTADPFEGRTTEDILKGLAEARRDDFEAFTRTNWEEGRRHGQGEATKQLDADKKRWGVEQQALATFDHWEAKRNSEDPYETQEFAKAIASPEVEAAYQMGKKLRQGPSSQEIAERAQFEIMTNVDAHLDERLSKQGALSDEEKGRIDKAKFKTIGELIAAKTDLIADRGIAAGRIKDDAKSLQEAREEGRREAYDEAGLEYPGDPIEGHKPERQPTKAEVGKMSVDELRKLDREGKLDKILAAHK